jgi:ketosteroid isomerase-like protein
MIDPRLELDVMRTYARYAHTIDDGDIRGWSHIFTDDGVMAVRGNEPQGPDALFSLMAASRKEGVRSLGRHLILNIEVLEADESSAKAVADFLHVMAGTGGAYIEMVGRYNSTMRRVGDEYKLIRHEVYPLVDKRNPEVPLG